MGILFKRGVIANDAQYVGAFFDKVDVAKIAEKIASRYARALFELVERSELEEVCVLLGELAVAWENLPDLRELMRNPQVPFHSRTGLISDMLRAAVKSETSAAAKAQVESFLNVLFENGRLEALPQVAKIFLSMVNELRQVLSVEVSSASELAEADREKLISKITQASGGLASVKWVIHPELLAGLRVKVGDRLLDSTIDGALERLRGKLLA